MTPAEIINLVALIMAAFTSTLGAMWFFSSYINKKFQELTALIFSESHKTREELVTELKYHEKHDDSRFEHMTNEIWAIKLRNASRDGIPVPPVYPPIRHINLDQENKDHAIIRGKTKT